MLDAFFKEYPSKLYLQVKFHPLKQHPHGLESALYAECATRQNKFWKFHHLLFENQSEWKENPDTAGTFHSYARQAGMDLKKLDACLANPLTEQTVSQENLDSTVLGIRSTPTFFINGKMIVGPKPLREELKAISPSFEFEFPEEGSHAQ